MCKPLPAEELNRENESNEKGVFEGVDEYPIRDESTARRSSIIKPGESVDPDIQEGTHEEIRPNVNTEVASAGLSTEVIAVIVAIVVVIIIVLIAVIAFKVRQNSQRRTQASKKQPTQKSNSYWYVLHFKNY